MQIDLSKIDRDSFEVKSQNGLNLVVPKNIGVSWNKDNLIFRSSIWNDSGELVSASFPKFFNWGEQNIITPIPSNIEECNLVTKMDGSTLIVSKYDDKLIIRTRGTFDACLQPNGFEIDILKEKYPKVFDNQWINDGYSLIYEWVTPNNRIVLPFEEVDIFFIGMIDHDNYKLVEQQILDLIGVLIEVKRPKVYSFSDMQSMLNDVKAFKGIEGICVYSNADQTIHKVKGDDYLTRHKLKSEVGSYPKLVDWYFENCSEMLEGQIEFAKNQIYVLTRLENNIDFETMIECKNNVLKIIECILKIEQLVCEFQQFIDNKLDELPSRREQAAAIQQKYSVENRCGFVFKMLDNKMLNKDEFKKLFWQVER